MRHSCLDCLPHAGQVDVDHVLPVGFTGLVECLTSVADGSIGNDYVESSELFHAAVHCGFERAVVTHVDLGGHHPAVEALDQVGGLGQIVWRRGRNHAAAADRLAHVDCDDV